MKLNFDSVFLSSLEQNILSNIYKLLIILIFHQLEQQFYINHRYTVNLQFIFPAFIAEISQFINYSFIFLQQLGKSMVDLELPICYVVFGLGKGVFETSHGEELIGGIVKYFIYTFLEILFEFGAEQH